jgi:hypothetical protein
MFNGKAPGKRNTSDSDPPIPITPLPVTKYHDAVHIEIKPNG